MSFVIVTKRCFLTCEKVTSVIIEELSSKKVKELVVEKKKKRGKSSRKTKLVDVPQYAICIAFIPSSSQKAQNSTYGGNGKEEQTLELRVLGKKEAYSLYSEIIREVQEQHPNEGYLDKLVEKMLAGIDSQ